MAAGSALPKSKPPASEKGAAKNPLFAVLNQQIFQLAGTSSKPKLSGYPQLLALLFILSETMSISRPKGDSAPEWSKPLGLQDFAKRTGVAKNSVWRMLTDAENRGLIESIGKADAKRAKKLSDPQRRGLAISWGAANPKTKRYRLCPENWKEAPAYEPPEIDDEELDATEPEAKAPEAKAPEAKAPEAKAPIVADLKLNTRWTVPIDKPARKCYVTSRTEDASVRVESRVQDDSVFLDVFVGNKQDSSGRVYLYVDGQKSSNTPAPVLKPGAPFVEHPLALEIGRGLASLQPPLYLDRPTASQTARQLTCPVKFFLHEAEARMLRAVRAGKPVTTGFVSLLVQNANEKWEIAAPIEKARYERQKEVETQTATQAHMDSLATARAILSAPKSDPLCYYTDSDREWAHKILAEAEAC